MRKTAALRTAVRKIETQIETTFDEICKAWGPPESEKYRELLALCNRTTRHLRLTEPATRLGYLGPFGEVMNARFAFLLAEIGVDVFQDDTIHLLGGGHISKTPDYLKNQGRWSDDRECILAKLAWRLGVHAEELLGKPPA